MIIGPGQTVRITIPLNKNTDGSYSGEWKAGDPVADQQAMPQQMFQMQDISHQVFGKYQFGTMHWGLWYSDEDFLMGNGCGPLKWGSIPAPNSPDRRPWYGIVVELMRRVAGAQRES